MIDVIVDQRSFRLTDRSFDGVQLLRELRTRPPLFDHGNDAPEMSVRPAQSFDNFRVALMNHRHYLSPWIG